MSGNDLNARQLWAPRTTTSAHPYCTPVTLPSAGSLIINSTFTITLAQNAIFEPTCTGGASGIMHGLSDNSTVSDFKDPFYASVSPQIYALAAATVVSYVLVIMLFITPRTYFVGGPGGGAGFLSRRGFMGGSYGNSAVIGVGRRPWLQNIAAVSVAISLTIATADTFRVAECQYYLGYSDSGSMVNEVTTSLEIRVIRVISDTFLWLAQVQTLIRLFPRHKEKVVIKWLGFALIVADTLFSILNNFVYYTARTRPRSFQDAVPALAYLFELAIGLIYASCIIYFSIAKRRFAFFHPKMRNICLVALMSFVAVLVPVVFFVLDVAKPDVAGWGDYIRWVGAAAASVVVWEWVERIEALERDERKDGILGREIFDGDEMLEVTPSEEVDRPSHGSDDSRNDEGSRALPRRRQLRHRMLFQARGSTSQSMESNLGQDAVSNAGERQGRPTPPPAAITPISRAETTSAASTQYAVRYHTVASPSPPPTEEQSHSKALSISEPAQSSTDSNSIDAEKAAGETQRSKEQSWTDMGLDVLRAVPNPFKRRKTSPPAEVASAMRDQRQIGTNPIAGAATARGWNLASKFDAFTSAQKDRLKAHVQGHPVNRTLPVTIIPAQPRGHRTWSPEDFQNASRQPLSTAGQPDLVTTSGLPVTVIDGSSRRTSSPHATTADILNGESGQHVQYDASEPQRSMPPLTLARRPQLVSRRGTLTISEDEPWRAQTGSGRVSPYDLPRSHSQGQPTNAPDLPRPNVDGHGPPEPTEMIPALPSSPSANDGSSSRDELSGSSSTSRDHV